MESRKSWGNKLFDDVANGTRRRSRSASILPEDWTAITDGGEQVTVLVSLPVSISELLLQLQIAHFVQVDWTCAWGQILEVPKCCGDGRGFLVTLPAGRVWHAKFPVPV